MKGKLVLLLMLAIIVPAATNWLLPPSGPTVSITRLYNLNLQPGQTIKVNITVSDASDVTACRINLAWDPNVLKVTMGEGWKDPLTRNRYGVYEGPFLKSFSNQTLFLINQVNNDAGNITAIYSLITSPDTTARGSGVIATINFTCVNPGTTTIRITGPTQGHSYLQSSAGEQIPHRDIDGLVTADGPPPIWMELWFQATVGVIMFETIVLALVILLVVRWWRSRAEAEGKEGAEITL